jgi:hypothetical protein
MDELRPHAAQAAAQATSIERRWGTMRRAMQARSSWIAVIASVAAAGCTRRVDHEQVEQQLQRELTEMKLHVTAVTCSPEVEAKEREMVPCKVEIEGRKGRKKTYAVDALILGSPDSSRGQLMNAAWPGGYDGHMMQTTDWEARLADELGKDIGGKVAVNCGDDPLLFLDAERTLRCQLIAGDVTSRATIRFDPAESLTSWELEPRVVARAKLEESAQRAVRDKFPGATIACGHGQFVRRLDDGGVDCTLTAGRNTEAIKLEFDALVALTR